MFESGLVFAARPSDVDARLPEQTDRLAWVMVGAQGPAALGGRPLASDASLSLALVRHLGAVLGLSDLSFSPVSPAGFHPGRAAQVEIGGRVVGHCGELSPTVARAYELPGRVAIAEIDMGPC